MIPIDSNQYQLKIINKLLTIIIDKINPACTHITHIIQGDSVAIGPKLLSINSLGHLATESPCIIYSA